MSLSTEEGEDSVELSLIGDRVDRFYMLRGQPLGYDSTSYEEHEEAPKTMVGQGISISF
jgi:hypothetical protein